MVVLSYRGYRKGGRVGLHRYPYNYLGAYGVVHSNVPSLTRRVMFWFSRAVLKARGHVFRFFWFQHGVTLNVNRYLLSRVMVQRLVLGKVNRFRVVSGRFIMFSARILGSDLFTFFTLWIYRPFLSVH